MALGWRNLTESNQELSEARGRRAVVAGSDGLPLAHLATGAICPVTEWPRAQAGTLSMCSMSGAALIPNLYLCILRSSSTGQRSKAAASASQTEGRTEARDCSP